MSLLTFFYVYILGGVTFLPLVVLGLVLLHPKQPPGSKYDRPVLNDTDIAITDDELSDKEEEESRELKAGEVEESENSGLLAYKSGWITVTQEYVESPEDISSTTQSINESPDNKSAYSTLYKLVRNNGQNPAGGLGGSLGPVGGLGTLGGAPDILESVEPTTASTEKVKSSVKRHRFYAVLKHGNLFLYKNPTLNDVKHVIVLSNQLVAIWPRNLLDGQLFTKYTAICLIKKNWSRSRRLSENFGSDKLTVNDILDPSNNLTPPKSSFFIHCDTNYDKEDWYFALVRGSKNQGQTGEPGEPALNPTLYAKTLHYNTNDMMDLIQSLYSSEGNLQTKWFNALLGRIFLSLKDTDTLHDYMVDKIIKKLNKVKTPGFLEKFTLKSFNAGNSIPFFTYPNLKEINPNGTTVVSTYVHYHGSMSCNLATKVNLSLGRRFQKSLSQSVDVVLKVTLDKLEGPMVFKIKPPPSNRIWYCFEIEPIMNLKIEPIISARQFSYNILTNLIEKRFKDAIKESLVAPHYDDIVFHKTNGELFRGGIWDKSVRTAGPKANGPGASPDPVSEGSTPSTLSRPEDDAKSVKSSKSAKSAKSFMSDTDSSDTKLNEKVKLSTTLSDLSKKIKKSKSSHTVSVNGSNFLSDGSLIESSNQIPGRTPTGLSSGPNNNALGKTWKKLGDWYSTTSTNINVPQSPPESEYHKPEMILSRRKPRLSTSEGTLLNFDGPSTNSASTNGANTSPKRSGPSPTGASPTGESVFEMFARPNELHSRKSSKFSLSSEDQMDIESKSDLTYNQYGNQQNQYGNQYEEDSRVHEELIRLEQEFNKDQGQDQDPIDLVDTVDHQNTVAQAQAQDHGPDQGLDPEEKPKLHRKAPPPLE